MENQELSNDKIVIQVSNWSSDKITWPEYGTKVPNWSPEGDLLKDIIVKD